MYVSLLSIVWAAWFGLAASFSPTPAPHKFHVSYGMMGVEGKTAMLQIKFFGHDLEETLQHHFNNADFKLAPTRTADSLYTAYFAQKFVITTGETVLQGKVVTSGEEEDFWWYIMQFDAPEAIEKLKIKNTLLFEQFEDQKNIFKVKHLAQTRTQSLYFVEGAEEYTVTL